MMRKNPGEGSPIAPKQESKSQQTPEYNLEDWLKKMTEEVKAVLAEQERAVISMAGASASGKGEASDRLKENLEQDGIETAIFSTDNFYKGISRMVTENLPNHLSEEELELIDLKDLNGFIHELTGKKDFGDKFSAENLEKIKAYIAGKYPQIDIDKVMEAIAYEKDHLDFDNPGVVDLALVADTIKRWKSGETVRIPKYSMKISEQDGSYEIDGSKIKAIIVEGLYGLDESVTEDSDAKSYVEAEIKSLLMRRMRRDILKGRSSFPPEMNLWITLEIVLPAFKKYILPTKENADSILANTYTEQETKDTEEYDVQDKVQLTPEDVAKIESLAGQPEMQIKQADYYFTNEELGHDPAHLIRVRVQDGEIKNLVHKGTKETREDGRIIRPTEEYIKTGEFGNWYKEPEKLAKAFEGAGFSLVKKIDKERSIYTYKGIELTVDKIDGLGTFVEFRANNKKSHEPKIDEIKEQLGLTGRPAVGPYIDEALAKAEAAE